MNKAKIVNRYVAPAFYLVLFPSICYLLPTNESPAGILAFLQWCNSLFGEFYITRYASALQVSFFTAKYYIMIFFLFHFITPFYTVFLCFTVTVDWKKLNLITFFSVLIIVLFGYFPFIEWYRPDTISSTSHRGTLLVGALYPAIVSAYSYVTAACIAVTASLIKKQVSNDN
ncbi:hypothetical protein [Roseibium marinum]|uniref:Uncharacterized protein n=1 Tax=Roseibium marinum TaxID=281252 RepID=A0A2S3UK69_9HYPH|nr:hypothetical protein [Roseibium marinum]POF28114.1 hypothetical protein CLV41_11748 [Roseibium marinum]